MISLYLGENSYESWKAVTVALEDIKERDIKIYYADDLAEKNVSFSSYSLFSTSQFVVIKRFFELNTSTRELYWHDIESSTDDFILWEDGNVDKRRKEYKFIKKKGLVREFNNLKSYELQKWINSELSARKIKVGHEAYQILLLRYGGNQWVIENEINKIAHYLKATGKSEFTKEDSKILSKYSLDHTWDFIDMMFERNKAETLEYINTTEFEYGDEFKLIGAIANQLRNIYLAKRFGSRFQKEFNLHPYVFKKATEFGRNFSLKQLETLYNQLLRLDFSLKTGNIEPKLGLSLIIASL